MTRSDLILKFHEEFSSLKGDNYSAEWVRDLLPGNIYYIPESKVEYFIELAKSIDGGKLLEEIEAHLGYIDLTWVKYEYDVPFAARIGIAGIDESQKKIITSKRLIVS